MAPNRVSGVRHTNNTFLRGFSERQGRHLILAWLLLKPDRLPKGLTCRTQQEECFLQAKVERTGEPPLAKIHKTERLSPLRPQNVRQPRRPPFRRGRRLARKFRFNVYELYTCRHKPSRLTTESARITSPSSMAISSGSTSLPTVPSCRRTSRSISCPSYGIPSAPWRRRTSRR